MISARSLRWLIFLFSNALLLAQPTLRLKVRTPTEPRNSIAAGNPILRGGRLPRFTPTHVIVQFDEAPTADALDALRARGATILQNVPDNAVLVLMNGTMVLDGGLDDLGITSARRLDPREKISPLITDGNTPATDDYYLIEFHPDVSPSIARRVVLNAGWELRENPDLLRQHLMVHIPNSGATHATLETLAAQDQIAYIFPASAHLVAGTPANICGGALTSFGSIGQSIATNGEGWDGPGLNATSVSYYFQQMTTQLPSGFPQGEILRAMAEWAKVIQITWQPGTGPSGDRNVNIFFAAGAHGDSFPFDGPGGVVAHTFYPAPPNPETLAGDMHLDEAESWRAGSNLDVFSVALHELGHALGLGHSDNPSDVMYPYFKTVFTLAEGDKIAIKGMYAAVPQDGGPLKIVVNAPPATTTSGAISLSGTVSGGSGSPSVTWTSPGTSGGPSIGGSNWTIPSVPLAIGINNITATATDSTGSISRTVTITRLAPPPGPLALTINVPPATTASAILSLTGTITGGTDPAISWTSSMGAFDGSTISGTDWVISNIPLEIGVNVLTVTAADATSSVSRLVSVTRTSAPPPVPLAVTINVPPASTISPVISLDGTVTGGSSPATVSWITNAGAFDRASVNGTNWSVLSIPLAIGLNTITVIATSATETVSTTTTVTRTAVAASGSDTTGPTMAIAYPTTTSVATTLASLTFKGTASDRSGVLNVTWSTNTGKSGTASGTTQWSAAVPLLMGINQVLITVSDTIGNTSWRTVVVTRK